jgi:hypothetical protein
VLEGGGDEPIAGDLLRAARPAPGAARLALEIPERLGECGVVSGDELLGQRCVADAEERADALGRLERHVEPGDRPGTQRPAERRVVATDATGEQRRGLPRPDLPDQLQRCGAGAHPASGPLPLTRVVVLAPVGERRLVVGACGRSRGELPNRHHVFAMSPGPREPPSATFRCLG